MEYKVNEFVDNIDNLENYKKKIMKKEIQFTEVLIQKVLIY